MSKLDQCYDIAEPNLLKIEAPTEREILDQLRDGNPIPLWVLKERLPTVPLRYFEDEDSMLEYLTRRFMVDKTDDTPYCRDTTQENT